MCLKYWILSSFGRSQIRCVIKGLCYHCQNLPKYCDKFGKDCLCECGQVQFEVFRGIVANASWVKKSALSARENAWPVTMCYTDEGAWTVLHSSSSPLPAMTLPTAPIGGINKWKPSSLTIAFPISSGNSATIFEIFWYNANNIPFSPANYGEIVLQAVFLLGVSFCMYFCLLHSLDLPARQENTDIHHFH